MKRVFKKENICYLLLFIILLGSILFMILSDSSYNHMVLSSKKWYHIQKKRKFSKKISLDKISFNGYDLLCDQDNTWYYSIVNKSYNPKIQYKAKSNLKVAINYKINDKNISNNKEFKIMIYNNKYYRTYNLVVTPLPIMNIKYDQEITKSEDTDIRLSLFDNRNGVSERVFNSNGSIHVRGASTSLYPKKGYKISLKDNDAIKLDSSLLGMREDDDWILYSAYNDYEKIRNVFSANLWKEASSHINNLNISNGMEYKYIELFMNNKYWGLYALGYPIDSKQLDLKEDEFLFKKKDWASSELDTLNDTNLESLKGYELKSDLNSEEEAWNLLIDYYRQLLTTNNPEDIYNLVDIDNEIDFYLFINLIQGRDDINGKLIKNSYISFKKKNNKYIAFYTPWDLDMTFGNRWTSKLENNTTIGGLKYNDNVKFELSSVNMLITLKDKNINNLIKKRYNYLRSNEWSDDHINSLIDKYEDDIYNSGAFLRDMNRWPEGNYNNYEIKLNKFRKYVLKRINYFDKYVKSL